MLEHSVSFDSTLTSSKVSFDLPGQNSLDISNVNSGLEPWNKLYPGSYSPQEYSQDFLDTALVQNGNKSNLVLGNELNNNSNPQTFPFSTSLSPNQAVPTNIDPITGENSIAIVPIIKANQIAIEKIHHFFTETDYVTGMKVAFEKPLEQSKITQTVDHLLADYKDGKFTDLPSIQLESDSVMGQTNAAFSADNSKIYINAQFAATASIKELTSVIAEEYGHAIDTLLSPVDSKGDEGELFAKIVTGETLNQPLINAIKNDDDRTTLFLDGKNRLVEQSQIAAASVNGRLYQSHRGFDNSIYTRSSTDGVNWTGWQQSGGGTPSAPSLAALNGRLYQSHRGFNNNIYTRSSTDGVNWTNWTWAESIIPLGGNVVLENQYGATTKSAPALVAFQGKLYQSYQGTDDRIYLSTSTDGFTWTRSKSANDYTRMNTTTYSAPTLAVYNGKIYESYRGTDNKIYTASSSDGVNWSGWTQQDGITPSAPTLSSIEYGSNRGLYQSHRGFDNKIYTRKSQNGINWTNWTESGGQTPTAPSLASFNNRLYQTHQGLDNNIYTRSSNDGVNWTNWQQSGGKTPTELNDLTIKNINANGKSFNVNLNMYDGNGKTEAKGLDSSKDTVVIIHGWNNDDEYKSSKKDYKIGNLAATTAVSSFYPNSQVVTLDWKDGAADRNLYSAAGRISAVARWGVDRLRELGINKDRTILIGHSLGAYVAGKMGEFFGGVKEIVALDPAWGGTNLDVDGDTFGLQFVRNFRDVASNSTALVASDSGIVGRWAGDNDFAGTANNSFIVNFSNYNGSLLNKTTDYHGAVVNTFADQVARNLKVPSLNRNGWYNNNGEKRSSSQSNSSSPHEGNINVNLSDLNNPKISNLNYVYDSQGNQATTWT